MTFIPFRQVLFAVVLLVAACCLSCGGAVDPAHTSKKPITKEPSKAHGDTPAHTSAYVCPMHCEGSGSDKAGVCPVCGMDYVALAEHTKNGHTH